jgi:hypothetical protein
MTKRLCSCYSPLRRVFSFATRGGKSVVFDGFGPLPNKLWLLQGNNACSHCLPPSENQQGLPRRTPPCRGISLSLSLCFEIRSGALRSPIVGKASMTGDKRRRDGLLKPSYHWLDLATYDVQGRRADVGWGLSSKPQLTPSCRRLLGESFKATLLKGSRLLARSDRNVASRECSGRSCVHKEVPCSRESCLDPVKPLTGCEGSQTLPANWDLSRQGLTSPLFAPEWHQNGGGRSSARSHEQYWLRHVTRLQERMIAEDQQSQIGDCSKTPVILK